MWCQLLFCFAIAGTVHYAVGMQVPLYQSGLENRPRLSPPGFFKFNTPTELREIVSGKRLEERSKKNKLSANDVRLQRNQLFTIALNELPKLKSTKVKEQSDLQDGHLEIHNRKKRSASDGFGFLMLNDKNKGKGSDKNKRKLAHRNGNSKNGEIKKTRAESKLENKLHLVPEDHHKHARSISGGQKKSSKKRKDNSRARGYEVNNFKVEYQKYAIYTLITIESAFLVAAIVVLLCQMCSKSKI